MNIIQYLPPVLQGVGDFIQIADAEQAQFNSVNTAMGGVADDLFLATLTEHGAARWEALLGIAPKGTDTLGVRRFRILTKLNEQTPYTIATLKEKLATLCGADGYSVTLVPADYALTVRVALTAKGYYNEVEALLDRMAPANLIVDLSLLYNQYSLLTAFPHTRLAAFTHNELRNEAIS